MSSKYIAVVTQEGDHMVISPIQSIGGGPVGPSRPVDPGYGVEAPVDPGYGGGHPRPPHISIRPPKPDLPVQIWPPKIDNELPSPPDGIWGGSPPWVDNTLPSDPDVPAWPETPEHPIEAPPGTIWPPLPPNVGEDKVVVVVWVPGAGLRYVVIDTSLKISGGPMPHPEPK